MSKNSISDEERKSLLKLARSQISSEFDGASSNEMLELTGGVMDEKRGCFVTLHTETGALRGCIGNIEPVKKLVDGVRDNAGNSAFKDPRFPSLTKEELDRVEIEISVLSIPRELAFSDEEDLKNKLKPGVHGVILSKGWTRATFLPQVWDQLPEVEDFLSHLCQKAGMEGECWKSKSIKIEVYEAEHFSE